MYKVTVNYHMMSIRWGVRMERARYIENELYDPNHKNVPMEHG